MYTSPIILFNAGVLSIRQPSEQSLLCEFQYVRDSERNVQRRIAFCPDVDLDKLIQAVTGKSDLPSSPRASPTGASSSEQAGFNDNEESLNLREIALSRIRNVSKRHSSFGRGNLPIPLEEGDSLLQTLFLTACSDLLIPLTF